MCTQKTMHIVAGTQSELKTGMQYNLLTRTCCALSSGREILCRWAAPAQKTTHKPNSGNSDFSAGSQYLQDQQIRTQKRSIFTIFIAHFWNGIESTRKFEAQAFLGICTKVSLHATGTKFRENTRSLGDNMHTLTLYISRSNKHRLHCLEHNTHTQFPSPPLTAWNPYATPSATSDTQPPESNVSLTFHVRTLVRSLQPKRHGRS